MLAQAGVDEKVELAERPDFIERVEALAAENLAALVRRQADSRMPSAVDEKGLIALDRVMPTESKELPSGVQRAIFRRTSIPQQDPDGGVQ